MCRLKWVMWFWHAGGSVDPRGLTGKLLQESQYLYCGKKGYFTDSFPPVSPKEPGNTGGDTGEQDWKQFLPTKLLVLLNCVFGLSHTPCRLLLSLNAKQNFVDKTLAFDLSMTLKQLPELLQMSALDGFWIPGWHFDLYKSLSEHESCIPWLCRACFKTHSSSKVKNSSSLSQDLFPLPKEQIRADASKDPSGISLARMNNLEAPALPKLPSCLETAQLIMAYVFPLHWISMDYVSNHRAQFTSQVRILYFSWSSG